jgi:hypothetical protein
MKMRAFLEKWGLTSLKINVGFLNCEFEPSDPDRAAAWDLYIELLTRIATQYLPPDDGDEKTALASIHSLFALTRETLKKHGSGAGEFAKVAIPVLNQVIRPFTARWHKQLLAGAFDTKRGCDDFRTELSALQKIIGKYTKALAAMAAVEDLTVLESDV